MLVPLVIGDLQLLVFVDIDECEDRANSCDGNATCSDTDGSYECACNAGYSGDGYTCLSQLEEKMEFFIHFVNIFCRY